jgi:hypothetical protein
MRVAQALSARRACAAAGAGAGRGPEHAGHGQQPDSHGAGDQKAATVDQLLSRHAQLAHFQGNLIQPPVYGNFNSRRATRSRTTPSLLMSEVKNACSTARVCTLLVNPKP